MAADNDSMTCNKECAGKPAGNDALKNNGADSWNSGQPGMVRTTVRLSIREGMFAQVFMSLAGTGSVFLTKFAVLQGEFG